MTTIAANGYFLVADNRTSITITGNNHYNSVSKQKSKNVLTDSNIKINLIDSDLTIRGNKILAIAGAGNTFNIDAAIKLINNYKVKENTEIKQILDIFECFQSSPNFTLIGILSNYESFSINIGKTVFISTYKQGDMIVTGSGSSIINTIIANSGTVDISHVTSIASRYDKRTSSSYSAYSAKENHLYGFITPTEEEVFNVTKATIDATFAGYGFSNPAIAHNVI